ncbi:MAG TPA: ribose 5-phosphate isomerase B [Candidatus Aminicenantes bacterium]|nr:ribose 5-phosphate isomerase B [Candidatus Aminicenantes bacterium]HHF43316.1 ribose 5-phosphate isomerase B [Candidatus Aminicenantes bacterium]
MKIALASDHAGYKLKLGLAEHLRRRQIDYIDFGCYSEERVDYVDFAVKALEAMTRGECDRAILVCGTGIGMGIVANKFKGIRATPCWDEYVAQMSRQHNNSNCLTLGGRVLPLDEAILIVDTWLDTPFEGGRHKERLVKISQIEERHFKI